MKVLAIGLFFLVSMAIRAQGDTTSITPETAFNEAWNGGEPVIGVRYENSFGRRLANTVVFLINYKRLLDNLPIGGYHMSDVGWYCEEKLNRQHLKRDLGRAIAIVSATAEDVGKQKYEGKKFRGEGNPPVVTLQDLCKWIGDIGNLSQNRTSQQEFLKKKKSFPPRNNVDSRITKENFPSSGRQILMEELSGRGVNNDLGITKGKLLSSGSVEQWVLTEKPLPSGSSDLNVELWVERDVFR